MTTHSLFIYTKR